MKGKNKKWTSSFMAALLLISTFLPSGLIGRAHADQAEHLVISQVYGAGGNSGSVYKNDFIELYNPTSTPVNLAGWSVQYASKAGLFSTTNTTNLSGTIPAYGYYLVQEAAGAGTQPQFPNTADVTANIAMSATDGKVALVNGTDPISGINDSKVVDFVGYGGANEFEGTAVKITSNANSAQRRPYANVDPAPGKGNAWDTDDNAADFYVGAVAAPRNTASPTEAPMAAVTSLQPKGINIQFLKDGTTVKVTGKAEAAEAGSTVKVYETSAKGTALGNATADSNGAFEISFTTDKALASVFVAATQSGLDESAAIQIDAAAASTSLTQAKLSYSVTNGVGTLIGGTGAAAANANINVYANEAATEKLNTQAITAGTSGDFTVTINNAPNTVYVTQTTSTAKGIMLQSNPVSVSKADTTAITKIADVRASDTKGQPINLNKYFTIEGVATVNNQILGTQAQNLYIQDDTAGINIFSTSLDLGYQIQKGDKVRITGKVLYYNGLTEFEPTSIDKISEGNPIPAAKTVTINDLYTYATAEPLEGSLITVTGKVSAVAASGANSNVTFVDDNSKATTLRVMAATGIKPDKDLVAGKSYTVTGVLGQYTTNASATNGYQVYPRDVKDIASMLGITHTALTEVYKGVNVEFEANADGAESVTVYYRATGTTDYIALAMVNGGDGRYTATLPAANVPQSGFEYYMEAKAGAQVQSAGSSTAPYKVTLIDDTTGPEISGMTPQDTTQVESPTPEISAMIDDASGVDETTVQFWLDGKELTAPAATISKTQVKYTPQDDLALGKHTVKVAAKDTKGNLTEKEWTFDVVPRFTGGNHYRGTTHNHTNISHDAAGTPEDALKAGKYHHYDWFAFSDHSHDIDPEKLGTDTVERKTADGKSVPERSGGSDWQLTKDLAAKYTTDDYVVFPAFEMTSTTWGHSNIFGTDNFIDRNINGKQYQDLSQYYAWVMTYDDIVGQFNHPDMSANAFNNFKPYDANVDKLFTMLEVGNGSGHYGYANAEGKFYSALDLGWHVAPTYGEDNHEGTWGQVNARTVIVASDLSQASLLHSMRNMRVYMEEDPNFTLDVLANGYYMGSTVDSKTLKFDIKGSDDVAEAHNDTDYSYLPTSYKSDDRIQKVELITNGGKVVDSYEPMTKDFTWNPTYTVTGGQQWFVIKVTQMDGERIYSSPIWSKEEPVDVKVNSIDVDGGVIIGGNPATLKATVANNGTQVVKNLKVDFYYDEVKQENLIGTNTISSILPKSSAAASATWATPLTGDRKIIAVVSSLDGLDLGDTQFVLPVKIKEPLGVKVLIDAAHGNENTSADSGTYKDNLKSFTQMLQKEGYTVAENKATLTDEVLSNVKVLVLTHTRTALTAAEDAAVAKFVQNGGSLLMAGKSNNSTDPTMNNALLTDMGSAIRMGNDGVFDLSKSGNFWSDPTVSPYAVRVHPGLVSNFITDRVSFIDYYSGTSLSGANNQPLAASDKVTILAKGNDTTYQGNIKGGYTYDAVSDDTGGSSIPLIASEEIGTNGRIIVSGMNIFNDKQMDESYEPKGNDEFTLNAINWLAHREAKVSKIADVRKLDDNTDVVVEGTVTTGAGVFFDAFYLQDETGGMMAFQEVPEGTLKPGDKVRVYGHVKTYENNKELEFTSFTKDVIKIGTGDPIQPKSVATGEATSAANQGLLVKVKGRVVSKYDDNSYVINDGSGDVLVFTDGYIVNQSGPVPVLKVGETLEAVGLSGAFSEGTRIRVRDTKELVGIDTLAPDAPMVKPVTDADETITGTAEAKATVKAMVDGEEKGSATAGEDGIFTISIPKQTAGTKISVTAIDSAGNNSPAVEVTVIDVTAPNAPSINPVNDNDEVITGTVESNATVIAKVNGANIGTATAGFNGTYTMKIAPQPAGSTISITAVDAAGNVSEPAEVKVTDEKVTKVSVTTAKPGTQVFKEPIQFTASSEGSRTPEYRFYIIDKKGDTIYKQDFGASNTITWTAKTPGTYKIVVEAKDKHNTGLLSNYFEARSELTFDVAAVKGKN
ncbi:Ig-like domain-containing protein [Neobacillus cucumis]|uniref:Ig-like domain-containing protein n=1 Tax=Neobacillus cucumis TaxID=1740721 RepID=UPI002E20EAEB|nr:Ig-like domain-containing protein [Neobacillus cucumis]